MSFDIGEYVVYGGTEICLIEEKVSKKFDGINEQDYFRLVPRDVRSSVYYVPADRLGERVRPLLTKDEIFSLIDKMPFVNNEWVGDKNRSSSIFADAFRNEDYLAVLSLMKALYSEKGRREANGKKLVSADEKALSAAHRLLTGEFAVVLGIREDEVDDFIKRRVAAANSLEK